MERLLQWATCSTIQLQVIRQVYKSQADETLSRRTEDCFMSEVNMHSGSDTAVKAVPIERRVRSQQDIGKLVESRNETLAILSDLASRQPFKANHDTQVLLQNFCESLIDYTASAHFQLYRHIDEDKERREPVQQIAGEIYPRISDITQNILDFNDKYDCEDHCSDLSELAHDLSTLGEILADRIELEDRLIKVVCTPRSR
jgi:regulator of sigma D